MTEHERERLVRRYAAGTSPGRLGFSPVTQWVMKGEKISPESFKWEDHGGWLYAFVVEGEVKYTCLTNRVLRGRLGDYSHRRNSQTDRLRGLIMNELAALAAASTYWVRSSGISTS
jgi:hypothetical protein